jgi:ABC-type lipoprotein export system ATPase subunit
MFTLENLLPIPLSDQIDDSNIWANNFIFEAGIRYFIEAPSGKGKTTLQHILYGLRKDYTGAVTLKMPEGECKLSQLSLDNWASIRQKRLSVIFQDLRLFLELSAMDNIILKNDLTKYKSEDEIIAMAEELGVGELLDKKCGQMSYGQRQRIAIIRAMCQPFEFLIMDEPFSHLDTANIKKCCKMISQECLSQKAGYAIASLEEKYFFEYDEKVKI